VGQKSAFTIKNYRETQAGQLWIEEADSFHLSKNRFLVPVGGATHEMTCGQSATVEHTEAKRWTPRGRPAPTLCPACVEAAPLPAFILRRDGAGRDALGRDIFDWPTLCVCPACNGASELFFLGATVRRKEMAALVRFTQEAHLSLGRYSNPISPPIACNCAEKVQAMMPVIDGLPWISRGAWEKNDRASSPARGINCFERVLTCSRALSGEEQKAITVWLRLDKCPGWTGVGLRPSRSGEAFVYTAFTTWDSSD